MTIRVCYNKFHERLSIIWTGLLDTMEISFPILFLIGLYLILMGDTLGFIQLVIGGILGFMLITVRLTDEESIYQKINDKFKIFEWNDDC